MALQASTFSSYATLKLGKLYQSWDHIKNSFHLAEVYKYSGITGYYSTRKPVSSFILGSLDLALEYFEKALNLQHNKISGSF